jgi:hypothetical protein
MKWSYWSLAFATLAMFASLAEISQSYRPQAAQQAESGSPDYLDDSVSEETLDQMRGLGASS